MSPTWLYAVPIAAIIAFCFWKPDFPRMLAPKLGISSEKGMMVFLVVYWIAIPVGIHRLMAQIRIE